MYVYFSLRSPPAPNDRFSRDLQSADRKKMLYSKHKWGFFFFLSSFGVNLVKFLPKRRSSDGPTDLSVCSFRTKRLKSRSTPGRLLKENRRDEGRTIPILSEIFCNFSRFAYEENNEKAQALLLVTKKKKKR